MQKDVTISWGTFDHGKKGDVFTVAQQLTTTSIPCERGVTIKAADGNSGTVYIGNLDVTANSTEATDGYELGAGDSVFLAVNNVNKIYAISTSDLQTVFWLSV